LVSNLDPAELASVVQEVEKLFYAERHERRLEMLRERLTHESMLGWQAVLGEAPELLDELTPGQRAQWQEHLGAC
jgi:hypothetical protein